MSYSRSRPQRIVQWHDDHTDAVGWIVIDRVVNGVSGGGLFMHAGATVAEVGDLAATMSYKNLLVRPQFGGAKGGIRFDARSPQAQDVLRRFMIDNRELLAHSWSTGADLYTSNEVIERIAREDLGLPSAFTALGAMVARVRGIPSQADVIAERMMTPWDARFDLESCATGISLAHAVGTIVAPGARIAIQGFGRVGASAAYLLERLGAQVVAISDVDGFIVAQDGLDVTRLVDAREAARLGTGVDLQRLLDVADVRGAAWYPRGSQTDEQLLVQLIGTSRPDVFTPCATRYAISGSVLSSLAAAGTRYVIAGANNAFASPALVGEAERRGVVVLPEWVSNSGNAILFGELLATAEWDEQSPRIVGATVAARVEEHIQRALDTGDGLWDACHRLAEESLAESADPLALARWS